MKILHLDFDDLKNPQGGGQAVRTFEINRRLAKKHQITVVTGNYPGAKNETIEKIKFIRVGRGKFPWDILTYLAALPKMAKTISHDILIENFTPPIGPTWLPLFTKKPVIAMVDWCFAMQMSQKYKLPFFIGERTGLKIYQNFIFPTEAIRARVLGKNTDGRQTIVLPNLPLSDFKSFSFRTIGTAGTFRTSPCILFIGRLDIHQKGIDLLLKAYQQVLKAINAPLYLAGEGRDKKRIEKIVRNLKLNKKVRFLGKISGQVKMKYFQEAKAICIPSRYETSCIVASESLVLKKPIICFNIPVLKEVTQNQAVFAKPFDVEDYAQKMIYAYKNADKISQSIKFKPLPTWDEIAERQEEFYFKCLKQRFQSF